MVLFNLHLGDNGVYTFPKGISLEMNVIARREFDLAYFDDRVKHVSNNTMETSSPHIFQGVSPKTKRQNMMILAFIVLYTSQ